MPPHVLFKKRNGLPSISTSILVLFLFTSGCKKLVTVPPPTTSLVTESVFSNNTSATSALFNIYISMYNNGDSYNQAVSNGLLADELTNYSPVTTFMEYYANEMESVNAPGPYINAFNYIYQANAIISGLSTYSGVTPSVKNQLIGESLFVRAFWDFYLTNSYGSIQNVTSTDYTINAVLKRSSQAEIYNQIISDLRNARSLLNSNFVDASDTTPSPYRVRPTKWASDALLARTYLFLGQWDSAIYYSSEIISNRSLFSLTSLDSVFLANSNEAILQQMIPQPPSTNATPDGAGFILIAAPSSSGGTNQCTTISPQLLQAFELGDQRFTQWISYYVGSPDTFYFPFKYKIYFTSDTATEYTMLFRLGEQFLIRSEAEAQIGNIQGAVADLNKIRERAGLSDVIITPALTSDSLENKIIHERQVELFTEWGHRWFDLIRTGLADKIMPNVSKYKNGSWESTDTLYPIPLSEIQVNPNLIQNPGYN